MIIAARRWRFGIRQGNKFVAPDGLKTTLRRVLAWFDNKKNGTTFSVRPGGFYEPDSTAFLFSSPSFKTKRPALPAFWRPPKNPFSGRAKICSSVEEGAGE